jgi:hypothetical protein
MIVAKGQGIEVVGGWQPYEASRLPANRQRFGIATTAEWSEGRRPNPVAAAGVIIYWNIYVCRTIRYRSSGARFASYAMACTANFNACTAVYALLELDIGCSPAKIDAVGRAGFLTFLVLNIP